jgi:hypothetical protein
MKKIKGSCRTCGRPALPSIIPFTATLSNNLCLRLLQSDFHPPPRRPRSNGNNSRGKTGSKILQSTVSCPPICQGHKHIPIMPMPTQPVAPAPTPARHDMSVILVTGSYDHEIRFWEAWSGICSRTIARSGESGVRRSLLSTLPLSPPSYDIPTASKSSRNLSRVRPRVYRSLSGTLIRSPTASVCWLPQFIRKLAYTRLPALHPLP